MKRKKFLLEFIKKNSYQVTCFFSILAIASVLYNYLLLIILAPMILTSLTKNSTRMKFSLMDLGFMIILLSELFSTIFSLYVYNSLTSVTKLLLVLCFYVIFKSFLDNKNRGAFLLILSWISCLFVILTIKEFIGHVQITGSLDFYELNNFKNFYTPFNIFNNEWASILLIFLPINMIQLFRTKSVEYRILFSVFILMNILCIIFSFSRGAYLSLFIIMMTTFLGMFKYLGLKKALRVNTFWIVCTGLVVISIPQVKNSFSTTISFNKTTSQQRSINGRLNSLNNFQSILIETPFFGYGQNNFVLSSYRTPLSDEDSRFIPRASNIILQILLERGLFGLLCYLGFIGILIFVIYKRLKGNLLTREKKAELIFLLSGILAISFRELTFSSLFTNDYLYFLFFTLIILLSPNDVSFNFKYNHEWVKNKNTLKYIFIGVFILIGVFNLKRHFIKKLNNQFIEAFNNNQINQSVKYIDKALLLDSDNIILNKHKAIAISKKAFKISLSNDSVDILNVSILSKGKLKELKALLQKILLLNEFDDEVHHGLAWISYMEKDLESTNRYLKKAIELNPYKGLYYCSQSIFQEKDNADSIVEYSLSKTLELNPEFLESRIYRRFVKGKEKLNFSVDELARRSLKERAGNNVILKAKLARLLLDKNPVESEKLLQEVTSKLPNLSRPWLYLTYLKVLSKKDVDPDLMLLNRTLAISGNDYLTNSYFGDYYRSKNNVDSSINHYLKALEQFSTLKSDGYMKSIFLSDLSVLTNMEFPNEMLFLFSPDVKSSELFSYIKLNSSSNVDFSQELESRYK